MKSTILHLLSLFLILGFTASCGKKESSLGTKNPIHSSNPLNASGIQAQNNLIAWYNNLTEGALPDLTNGLYAKYVTYNVRTISTDNGCNSKPISLFGLNLGNFNICTSSSSIGSGDEVKEFVTLIPNGDKKINNPKLAAALASAITPGANGLTLVNVTQSQSMKSPGSVFVLTYTNASQQSVIQVIDTGFNSRLNPLYTYDGVNGKETTLIKIQY